MDALPTRALVYRGPLRGQGIGRTMRGVAAAIALAAKHGRIVCVHWRDFEAAFITPAGCEAVTKDDYFIARGDSGTATLDHSAYFELWSFGEKTDEVPEQLLASNKKVVVMSGDGGSVSEQLEAHHNDKGTLQFAFKPNIKLSPLLPKSPRRVVAHLRVGDPHETHKRGLFQSPNATDALCKMLPKDTYVLSDSDEVVYGNMCGRRDDCWFDCPMWRSVPHSSERSLRKDVDNGVRAMQTLQTWADWWSIKTAYGYVLATPSSFAASALMFNQHAERCELESVWRLRVCAAMIPKASEEEPEAHGVRVEL